MQIDIGLVNTIVARSSLSFIDGEIGVLEYVGLDIDDLAKQSTFEETTYLLWNGRLPSQSELAAFTSQIRSNYDLSEAMVNRQPYARSSDSNIGIVSTRPCCG